MKILIMILGLIFTYSFASAAPTERGFTIQYTEPSNSMCAATTSLRPQHNTTDLCVQGLGSESRQEICDHTKNQLFEMIPQAQEGLFQLQSSTTLKCLKVGNNTNDPVIETTCGIGDQNQVFRIGPSPSPIQSNSGAGGLCIDVAGNATAAGTKLQSWTCHGGDNQSFAYALSAPNQCPLDDLAGTKIYMDVIKDGVGGTVDTVNATAKTGGGDISKKYCVPILDDTTATHINIEVTAFDEAGNESPKTPTLVHQVQGTRDCSPIPPPDTTPPAMVENLKMEDPQP